MTRSEKHARAMLEAEGFGVTRIPEVVDNRRADFLVADDTDQYFAEVTERADSDFIPELASHPSTYGTADDSRDLGYSNRLDGIIRDKTAQLEQTDEARGKLRVVWLASLGCDAPFVVAQLHRTLYGVALLSVFRPGPSFVGFRPCYFYHRFTFYNTPGLDAVVFATPTSGCLFVNSLSDNAARFRQSKMYSLFDHARVDPQALQQDSQVLFVARDVDRAARRARWEYLKETYGVMTSVATENQWQGFLSLPK